MKRIAALWIVLWSFCSFMTACGGGGGDAPVLSSQNAISAYILAGVSVTIDEAAKTISVVVPALTDVSSLSALLSGINTMPQATSRFLKVNTADRRCFNPDGKHAQT